MNQKAFSTTILTILLISFCGATTFSTVFADNSEIIFDHFEGTEIDTEKWIVTENTEMSGRPAYGGTIEVSNSRLHLSSDGSSYPWIVTAKNPFPTTGDFAIEFDCTYTIVSDWGNGILFTVNDPYIQYLQDVPSSQVRIFQLWADNKDWTTAEIFVYLLGEQVHRIELQGWEPSGPELIFKLQYTNETYTLFINSVPIASAQSHLRPNMIEIGHPPVDYVPHTKERVDNTVGTWNSLEIDYFKLVDPTETITTQNSSNPSNQDTDNQENNYSTTPLEESNPPYEEDPNTTTEQEEATITVNTQKTPLSIEPETTIPTATTLTIIALAAIAIVQAIAILQLKKHKQQRRDSNA